MRFAHTNHGRGRPTAPGAWDLVSDGHPPATAVDRHGTPAETKRHGSWCSAERGFDRHGLGDELVRRTRPTSRNRHADTETTIETRSLEDVAAGVADKAEAYGPVSTGMIVLVRVGDQIEVVTSGRSDKAHHIPMGADQTFPIASITKPMTAAVVLQLVAEGRLL